MDIEAQIGAIRNHARMLRRHLGMTIRASKVPSMTNRHVAMHEAAHCVVAMAYGMPVFFVHMGHVLGGRQVTVPGSEGLCVVATQPDMVGPFAIAGMVQTRADWLGVSDAAALMQYITRFPQIGAYPNRNAALTKKTIAWCKRQARDILRREKAAVRAIAKLITTPGRVHFDGAEVRDVALSASTTLPGLSECGTHAAELWARAMAGDDEAHGRPFRGWPRDVRPWRLPRAQAEEKPSEATQPVTRRLPGVATLAGSRAL